MSDPYGDPVEIDWTQAWTLHCRRRYPDSLPRDRFEQRARELLARVEGVLGGVVLTPDPLLEDLARTVGVATRLPPDGRPVTSTDHLPTLDDMARVAQDIAPATGDDAPDRVLGPWVDVLEADNRHHRRMLLASHAAALFMPVDEDKWQRTPFVQWVRRQPHPPLEDREPLRAVEHAAPSLWRVATVSEAGLELVDLIGINPRGRPSAPVQVPELASLDGTVQAGDCLLARVVPTPAGWVAAMAYAVPGCPSVEQARTWVAVEGFTARLGAPVKTLDDLLRLRPHVLWRRAHEWAWHRRAHTPSR